MYMGLEITRNQASLGLKQHVIAAAVLAMGAGLVASIGMVTQVFAASSPVQYTTPTFTHGEVGTWSPDRSVPTGGYESTSYGDRSNVLEMRLDGTMASTNPFLRTEGLRKQIPNSDSVKADVYVDSAWGAQTVRAGLWGIGRDAAEITAYPIVEYSTDNNNQPNFPSTVSGWRYWDSNHWVSLPNVKVKDGWNTLAITRDSETGKFVYRINGIVVASVSDEGSTAITDVILNSRNYDVNYTAHWSNFAYGNVQLGARPTSTNDCKNNNWQSYGVYKNQGQCVSSVASKK